ncbi:Uncharacterized protein PCOAH_00035140 [Plasmodium coatneyi]|uniref:VWFA domain-containing protein n=1 Tax=Plasmodium coatneyi TaxID=208452 RepID=A0A1B1E238_9APIC|nr:Uncharacterized protein PCOAH_00035140 [Plasmodium coatneyi]ANQ09094.1 Uncharacterized protein PCOAH_00035140 [Plasmodium coatneyi]
MRRIFRVLLNWILPFFLFHLTQVEGNGLIEKVTSKGDLDLVILFDAGFKENKEKNRSKALENIAELARNLLVEGGRKVNLTYVTYDSVSVQTVARADNKSAKGNASTTGRTSGSLDRFSKAVMQTQSQQSQQSSNHLKALSYVGMKHFYDAEDTSTKMIIMFINTEGIPARDDTELNLVHYLLDRKNITLNVITKVNLKSYCHYLHKVGPNTNELLRCVLKNSFYHKLILTYTLEKFYDDIATNAKCSDWSEWSECSVTCNMGYHYSKRNTLENVENTLGGKYKRTGKNCTDQRSLIIQECFDTSCDHSLDVCDIEVDLSLLIDDSSNMSQDFWLKYILKPVRNLISHLNLSSKLVNISITTFSKETYNWVSFSSNLARNRDELLLFLEYWRFNFGGPSSNLTSALNYMHDHVLNSNEARPNAHKILVIFNTGDVSNKTARGAEKIVQNIKMNYEADVYSICLKNTREGNCEAISGANPIPEEVDSPADVTNQDEITNSSIVDAPFFYSYSNVSEFREQLTDIQKNICKNAHQAIVARRRRRRKNLRRGDDTGEASTSHGRRGASKAEGQDDESDDDVDELDEEEAAKKAGKKVEKGTTDEEAEVHPRADADADGGAELETESAVEADADATSESGQEADLRVVPDVVVESVPPEGLHTVPGEPTNETEKMAQNLHVPKPINIVSPYYPTNGGNLKHLNKNRVILKSFTNLDRIDDVEEEEVDVEPAHNSLKKYSSQYNIDVLPSYKSRGTKKLICRLLKFLFRKKKQYRLKKIDPKDKEKIKQFIEDVKGLNESEGTYHQREKEIEEDFNVLLENIFKNIGTSPFSDLDFDSVSVSSYGSYLEDVDELGVENTLPCSWFYIDAAQMNVDNVAKGANGTDVDDPVDADTAAGSSVDMDNNSDGGDTTTQTGENILDDVSIADILVKEGGFPTSEKRKLNRRKRSLDQAQGQTTPDEENHGAKDNGPGGSAENRGGEEPLLANPDEEKKGQYDKTGEGHDGRVVSSPAPPDGSKPPTQRKFKSKFDIIQRFKKTAAVVDDKTGVSFDAQKYPPVVSNEGKSTITPLEEHTEEKKDNHSSEPIPNSPKRTKRSEESNKLSDQSGVVPPPSNMNYKKTKQSEATIVGRSKPNGGDVKVDNNPGIIKEKNDKTSSGAKNETHAHDPNEQVQYDLLQQKDSSNEWGTGHYDVIQEEEEHADSSIYKYSASFALIGVVLLGAAFLYIRSQKNLMDPGPETFNDFVTHNKGKKAECREQHVVVKPDETSWQ